MHSFNFSFLYSAASCFAGTGKRMTRLLALFLLMGVSGLHLTAQPSKPSKPNLLVIMTDDQGYADVGFNGGTDIPTPHLDSIAANGVRFTNGYVTHSVCGPSRAGFITGRYQGRFGFNNNPSVDPKNPKIGVAPGTIAEVLRPEGYTSAIIGKWHLGSHPSQQPLSRGFDYFFGFLSGGHSYFAENLTLPNLEAVTRDWEWYRTRLLENHERIDIDGYLTDELTDAADGFIQRAAQSDQPFCLFVSYNAPHTPLEASAKYLERFAHIENEKRRTYAAMVSSIDDGAGQLLGTLRQLGLEEETIVVFLSDNGGPTNNASRNTPLRGFKSDYYEGGIRVPFALQWKGVVPAGIDYHEPVISLDIMGTIVGQSGASIAAERPLDGVDLVPFLTGERTGAPHETLFWRNPSTDSMAVRSGDWKLVANRNLSAGNFQLYNIAADPSERRNLANEHPDKVARLKTLWEEWNAQLKDQAFPSLGDKWWTRL